MPNRIAMCLQENVPRAGYPRCRAVAWLPGRRRHEVARTVGRVTSLSVLETQIPRDGGAFRPTRPAMDGVPRMGGLPALNQCRDDTDRR